MEAEISQRKHIAKLRYELELKSIERYELQLTPYQETNNLIKKFYYKAVHDNKLGAIEHEIQRLNIEIGFAKDTMDLKAKYKPYSDYKGYDIQGWLDKQKPFGTQRPPPDPTS
jgi:hypothetical protein